MVSFLRKRDQSDNLGRRTTLPFAWVRIVRMKIVENLGLVELSRFFASTTAFVVSRQMFKVSKQLSHQLMMGGVSTLGVTDSNNSSTPQVPIFNLPSNSTQSEEIFELTTQGLYGIVIASGFVIMILTFLIPCLRSMYLKKAAVYAVE